VSWRRAIELKRRTIVSHREYALLRNDVAGVQAFLDEFPAPFNGEIREAAIGPSGKTVSITNMPLPDGFEPDFVDLAILLPDYPATPPIGLYLLRKSNAPLISQLKRIFNVFDHGFHDAPTIVNYDWACLVYEGNRWRYNASHVASGDNLRKFLIRFFNHCQQGRR
jgi:hypothetical protein